MSTAEYFGEVRADWAGFSSNRAFKIPYFGKEATVFLGEEYDDEGEEIDAPPSPEQLEAYAETLSAFLGNIHEVINDIKRAAFDYYLEVYAHYYEAPFEVLFTMEGTDFKEGEIHQPLCIGDREKHFDYMKDLIYVRILDDRTIQIPIRYMLDGEHGLEIKLTDNKVSAIGGIAET